MNNESQTINISEFIKFYCNHNNIQYKLMGEIVCAIKNKLKLRIDNNEIKLNCDTEELESFISELNLIFLDSN